MTDTTTPTMYVALISVNGTTVDEQKFVDLDREVASRRYKNVFMQNTVGEDIFDAIASKSGSKAVGRNEASILYSYRLHITPIHFE